MAEVLKAIDKMVGELAQEKKDEIMQRDTCINQLNENERLTESTVRDQTDLQAKIDSLEAKIKELTEAISVLEQETAEMATQMKRAGEDREKENKDFQMTVADQREAMKLLNKALSVLQGVYAKQAAASPDFVQLKTVRAHSAQEPPPEGFSDYKQSDGAGGVIGLMNQIINDAKHMEAEAIRDEQTEQEKYESFVKETNMGIDEKRASIVNKKEIKGETEQELTQAKTDLSSEREEHETLDNEAHTLHQACDFLMKNFELRQEGFAEEIDALKQAKAILRGMKE
jgi:chromosome segregation ATPase